MSKKGFKVVNYLDDFGMAETSESAVHAFKVLGDMLAELDLEESVDKAVASCVRVVFLGILIDTEALTLEVPSEKLSEIKLMVKIWLEREIATRREIESLVGKLKFFAQCVKPGRGFLSRLLERMRQVSERDKPTLLGIEFNKDLLWWDKLLDKYNGVSIISDQLWCTPDQVIATDACLEGGGGICFENGQYFHVKFTKEISESAGHINGLEMFAIIIAAKLWGRQWAGKRIKIQCDNLSTVQVLNTGKSRDLFMLECLRELLYIAAIGEFEIRACHISGVSNRLADHLSRWYSSGESRRAFKREITGMALHKRFISAGLFHFINNW